VLVLLVVGQECLSLWLGVLSQRAVSRVNHTLLVEREGERLLSAALDEEMSLREYLLTRKRSFLEPYKTRQLAFRSSLNRLYILLQDNPTQLKHLDQIKDLHDRWQDQLAQKTSDVSRPILAGQTLFAPLRSQVETLLQREEILLGDRNYQLHQLYQINTGVDILIIVVLLAGVSWNLWLLHRRVAVPLHQLTKVGAAWRMGQMKVRLDYSSPDEIGQLAVVLDAMADEICDRQERSETRSQQLEDLICALSHDLRTPLLAASSTLHAMLGGAFGPVNDTWRDVIEEYRQANEDLLKLVEALLEVSRYEASGCNLNCEPLNWEKIFLQVTASLSATAKRKCAFTLKIPQSLPTVKGDEIEIRRVMQNLLDNAMRVSEQDLQIILDVAPLGNTLVRVSVHDNGPGIAPQEKERLFQRFIQGRGLRGRAGLGLYLCRQLVEAHGGTINVESTLGAGSTFWFTLPVTIAALPQPKKEMYEQEE